MNKKGYIDPGTGGYVIGFVWTLFHTLISITLAALGLFLLTFLIKPLRKYKIASIIILVLVIIISGALLLVENIPVKENISDTSLLANETNAGTPSAGYILYRSVLMDESGRIVNHWRKQRVEMGLLLSDGTFIGKEGSKNETKWGKYSWNATPIYTISNYLPHHMFSLTDSGNILTLSKEVHEYEGKKVEFDIILEYDSNLNLIDNWSTWDNLETIQSYHDNLDSLNNNSWRNTTEWGANYDYYHANSIKELPANANENHEINIGGKTFKPFQKGNWITSFRHGSMIFILDKETKQIVWHAIYDDVEGNLEGPHDPTMLENGNIQIFDNGRYREWSRVIELNPISMEIEYEFKSPDFFTLTRGRVQLLENGNRLIVESDKGRMFEINKNKDVIWVHHNPGINSKTGNRTPISYAKKYSREFIDTLI